MTILQQTQTQRFLLDADRAYLARINRRILRGDTHLIAAARELLPIVGREAQGLARTQKEVRL